MRTIMIKDPVLFNKVLQATEKKQRDSSKA